MVTNPPLIFASLLSMFCILSIGIPAYAGEPDTTFDGHVGIGYGYVPETSLLVRSSKADPGEIPVSETVQIQRFSYPENNIYVNPKALRVWTVVQPGVSSTEWAISGELESYSNEVSTGNTATSGVAVKRARGQVFGGHFQSRDVTGFNSNDPTRGGSIVGAEINLSATGDDDYVTPTGYPGIRIGLDLPALTETQGANRGKYGAALRIRNSEDGGVWKKGVHVYDHYGTDFGEEPMSVGIEVTTRGAEGILVNGDPDLGLKIDTDGTYGAIIEGSHSIVDLFVIGESPSQYGIVIAGDHSTAAIRVPANQFIALEDTAQIKFRYEVVGGEGRIQFYAGQNKIGYLSTAAGQNKRLN